LISRIMQNARAAEVRLIDCVRQIMLWQNQGH
jgi:hypothetical protein